MEQYTQPGGAMDTPSNPVKVSEESKQIRSVESIVKQLQDTVATQHQEMLKLRRDISRLKDQIGEITQVINRRG